MEKRIGVGWMLVINANGRDRQEGHLFFSDDFGIALMKF